jgi:SAM-dependent methyltransferase
MNRPKLDNQRICQKTFYDSNYYKLKINPKKGNELTLDRIYKSLFTPLEISGCIRGDRNSFALNLLRIDNIKGKKILDYGCGTGDAGLLFAFCGAQSFGFDISIEACKISKSKACLNSQRFYVAAMSADNLAFQDESFDYIFGTEVLHHTFELPHIGKELWRVLKPGGKAIFCEGLGANFLINLYRNWKTKKKRIAEIEGNPTMLDYLRIGKNFNYVKIYPMHLMFMLKTLFGWRIESAFIIRILVILRQLDRILIKALPSLGRFCGEAVILYEK